MDCGRPAAAIPVHLAKGDHQGAAVCDRTGLQQGLFLLRAERTGGGQGIDQRFVRRLLGIVPVCLKIAAFQLAAERFQQLRPFDFLAGGGQVGPETGIVGLHPPVAVFG